ncbi:MAG: hypothetical protein Q4D79_11310 [Propionibacteriaceae bacterium]|nr:hypothetical protein [Propionibacteriaceae bacterium]
MEALTYVLLALGGLVLLGLTIWGVARWRYVQSLKALGWEFDSNPGIDICYGLNIPPFGVGFEREVDDSVRGQATDQTPFIAFKYRCTQWRSTGYVIRMPLPASLAAGEVSGPGYSHQLYLSSTAVQSGDVLASAATQELASRYAHALQPVLINAPFRISIDHDSIVLIDAPKKPEHLAAAVELLTRARAAVLALPQEQFSGPPAPPALSIYGHNNWVYLTQDDSFLARVSSTEGGHNHKAKDVVYGTDSNISFIRLTHTWQTTSTYTDGNGNTRTRVENHEEQLCEFRLQFPFYELTVNWGWLGASHKFEWGEFNQRFKVRCPDARFASDVIHQRQMEYLMAAYPGPFAIWGNGTVAFRDDRHWTPGEIEAFQAFLIGFFARVPNFVWQNLGAWPRPVAALP